MSRGIGGAAIRQAFVNGAQLVRRRVVAVPIRFLTGQNLAASRMAIPAPEITRSLCTDLAINDEAASWREKMLAFTATFTPEFANAAVVGCVLRHL